MMKDTTRNTERSAERSNWTEQDEKVARRYAEMSNSNIAMELGVPVTKVQWSIQKARQQGRL